MIGSCQRRKLFTIRKVLPTNVRDRPSAQDHEPRKDADGIRQDDLLVARCRVTLPAAPFVVFVQGTFPDMRLVVVCQSEQTQTARTTKRKKKGVNYCVPAVMRFRGLFCWRMSTPMPMHVGAHHAYLCFLLTHACKQTNKQTNKRQPR